MATKKTKKRRKEKGSPRSTAQTRASNQAGNVADRRRMHDEASLTIRRAMLTLIAYSFFCLLILAQPDEKWLENDVKVPFANVEISFVAFLVIGPLILTALTIYLHVFITYWHDAGGMSFRARLPFIFNMDYRVARYLASFLFYWLPAAVLLAFTLRTGAHVNPFPLATATIVVAISLAALQAFRRIDNRPRWRIPANWLGLGAVAAISMGSGWFPALEDLATSFGETSFRPSGIRQLNLARADLRERNLTDRDLSGANLQEADLKRANLTTSNLARADLTAADLKGAQLRLANLSDAVLTNARLSEADLIEADLTGVVLDGALLTNANLDGTLLRNARLTGADLRGVVGLTQEQLDLACTDDERTRLPAGLSPPESCIRREYCALLTPLMQQFDRTKAAFEQWTVEPQYVEVKKILSGNTEALKLLERDRSILPLDLRNDARRLIEHYRAFALAFTKQYAGQELQPATPIPTIGAPGTPFPGDAELRLRQRFDELGAELGSVACS